MCIDIELAVPGCRARWTRVPDVVVDAGAEISWFPEAVLRGLGVGIFKTDEPFPTADGRRVNRDVGVAFIRPGPFKTVDEVVFGTPGDLALLGARTLEGFNATVDTRRRKLVAAAPMRAATSLTAFAAAC